MSKNMVERVARAIQKRFDDSPGGYFNSNGLVAVMPEDAASTAIEEAVGVCAQIADRAAASAARWLPDPSAEAKVSIAKAIAAEIRALKP